MSEGKRKRMRLSGWEQRRCHEQSIACVVQFYYWIRMRSWMGKPSPFHR